MLQSRFSSAASYKVSAPQPSTPHVMTNHRWGNGTARTGVSHACSTSNAHTESRVVVLYMDGVYFSYKNTIVWYLKTDPGESYRLGSPPMRTAEWTAGQRGKIGFSTIEERILASLRGIICQKWNAEMIRCCSYLNLELSLIRPQQQHQQQSIHSHASTIALQQSPSQPASQLTLSTEYPLCTSQSMHVIPTTPLLPNQA